MHSLLSGAHVPLFRQPHVSQFVPVIAPVHFGVGSLNTQSLAHVLQGPVIALPLMHHPEAPHQPHPEVDVQCSWLPMAAHLESHGICTSIVREFTNLGAFMIGGKCDTHSSASSRE